MKKLKPFIACAGAKCKTKSLDQKVKIKCTVRSLPNACMNEELMLNWIKTVLRQISFICCLFAWDTFDLHITARLLSNIYMLIPGDQTKYTKAPDLWQIKSFFRTGN